MKYTDGYLYTYYNSSGTMVKFIITQIKNKVDKTVLFRNYICMYTFGTFLSSL